MFNLSIVTPEKVLFQKEQVVSLIAPGMIGYLEILTNHASIITSLQPGKLVITDKNGEKSIYAVSGGFLEVSHNEATLLADAIEAASEIDIKRAEAAREKAIHRLDFGENIERVRSEKSLRRAQNRINVYTKGQGT